MTITIVAYSELKEFIGESGKISLEVEPGATLGDVAEKLGLPRDRVMNVVCGGSLEGWDSFVRDGCVYQVLPLVCGG